MTRPTHVVQSNGSSRGPLIDTRRPYPEAIRFSLNRMNGSSFWAYSLWRAPEGADLLEDIRSLISSSSARGRQRP